MKKLGKTQRAWLAHLNDYGVVATFGKPSSVVQVLDSLVRRGLASRTATALGWMYHPVRDAKAPPNATSSPAE